MLLKNSLYKILSSEESVTSISFDPTHPIFSGHFPGHPIVPGACLVQIAEEILSEQSGEPIQWANIRNLKFRQAITPEMKVEFTMTPITENTYSITINHSNELYAQFTATYMRTDTHL